MTLPNKLTIGRIAAVPAMIIVAIIPYLRENNIFANVSLANFINFLIFFAACVTDFFDGMLARKLNQVTTFGKFADPLADKMLVLTSFLLLTEQQLCAGFGAHTALGVTTYDVTLELASTWAVAIILIRELMVSGIRLVAAQKGEVIAAGWSGKVKTFVTMIALGFVFMAGLHNVVAIIGLILVYIAVILTIYSGAVYFWNARKLILESV